MPAGAQRVAPHRSPLRCVWWPLTFPPRQSPRQQGWELPTARALGSRLRMPANNSRRTCKKSNAIELEVVRPIFLSNSSSIFLASVLPYCLMYSLHTFVLIGYFSISIGAHSAAASCLIIAGANMNATLACLWQNDNSTSSGFSSKPAGSTQTSNATTPPKSQADSINSGFQTKPGGQIATSNAAMPHAAVPAPPMSPILKFLVMARDSKMSITQREAALVSAQSELSKLPATDQATYAQFISATRRRLVVDIFLAGQGQVQIDVPAQTK